QAAAKWFDLEQFCHRQFPGTLVEARKLSSLARQNWNGALLVGIRRCHSATIIAPSHDLRYALNKMLIEWPGSRFCHARFRNSEVTRAVGHGLQSGHVDILHWSLWTLGGSNPPI